MNWHVQTVHFDSGQTREITCDYAVPFWFVQDVKYILKTGRNWDGPIGETTVAVDASAPKGLWRFISLRPKAGWTVNDGVAVWHRTSFKPTEDISAWMDLARPICFGEYTDSHATGDGEPMRFMPSNSRTYMRDGDALVDADYLAERLWSSASGQRPTVKMDSSGESCTFSLSPRWVRLKKGSKRAVLEDGRTIFLTVAPTRTSDGALQVPVLSVAKALGFIVVEDPRHNALIVKERASARQVR
jgi:hypothetical protein